MGRLFHPHYTRDVPPGTKVVTQDGRRVATITVKGRPVACEVRDVRGRPRAVVVLSDRWAIEWTAADGSTRQKTVGKDKRVAVAALGRAEEQAARVRHGLPDHATEARARLRPLTELFDEYGEVLAGRDTGEEYRTTGRVRLDAVRAGCRWETWADVSGDDLTRFLGRIRDARTPQNPNGLSPSTLNGYLRTVKAFCNWYAAKVNERSPVEKVGRYAEGKDRRRSRRVLTDEEFERLLVACRAAPRRHGTLIPAADRAVLYTVAAYTGLRASELARLTPESFALAAEPPTVTVLGKDKLVQSTPLPGRVAAELRPWLAGKRPGARLWPGTWAAGRKATQTLKRDAKRAGLGPGVTFHGLRRKFVTGLIRRGNDVDVVRRLARHKDLKTTLDYYAVSTDADLAAAVETLAPEPEKQPVRNSPGSAVNKVVRTQEKPGKSKRRRV